MHHVLQSVFTFVIPIETCYQERVDWGRGHRLEVEKPPEGAVRVQERANEGLNQSGGKVN